MTLKKVCYCTAQRSISSKSVEKMERTHNTDRLFGLIFLLLVIGLTSSCKKEPEASKYVKAIMSFANRENQKCPLDKGKGIQLQSVTFGDNTLTYRYSVSDEAITTVNVNDSNTRKSIIGYLPEKMKEYIVKGNCKLKYLYVSQRDSSYLEIIPEELGKSL